MASKIRSNSTYLATIPSVTNDDSFKKKYLYYKTLYLQLKVNTIHDDQKNPITIIDQKTITKSEFKNKTNIKKIKICKSVTTIDNNAFASFENLHTVIFDNKIRLYELNTRTFYNCQNLESITLPNSLKTINDEAFANCHALAKINLGNVTSIGNQAFNACFKLHSLELKKVKTIGENAFDMCRELKSIELGEVTSIGKQAFADCQALEKIDLKNVQIINDRTFIDCKNLKSIELKNVTSIGMQAFGKCHALKKIDLQNVKTIGKGAFLFCKALDKIDLQNVQTIGLDAFSYCHALTEIVLGNVKTINDGTFYKCINLESINLNTVTSIGAKAFFECKKLQLQLQLQSNNLNNVTSIGLEAFYKCNALTEIDLQNVQEIYYRTFFGCETLKSINLINVTSIGKEAFSKCKALTEIDLQNVQTIGSDAFSYCHALTKIDLRNVQTINNGTFNKCINLESINLNKVTSIGKEAFFECKTLQLQSNNLNNVTSIGARAFYNCRALTEIVLENVETINDGTFNKCINLESINLNKVTSIGEDAFSYCDALKNIVLENVEIINDGTFHHCINLESINLNKVTSIGNAAFFECKKLQLKSNNLNNVTSIGARAFSYCHALTEIVLESVKTINAGTFYKCINLKSINLNKVTSIGNLAFFKCNVLTKIDLKNVETIGKKAFHACENLESINLNTVTSIGEEAFAECKNLTKIDLQTVQTIGSDAFSYCHALTKIVLKNVETINYGTFYQCINLNSINLNKVTSIGHEAFFACEKLQSIELNNVKTIDSLAFFACEQLHSINLDNVERINDEAFHSCKKLEKVILNKNLSKIHDGAFHSCYSLKEINLEDVKEIGDSVFVNCENLQTVNLRNVRNIGIEAFKNCINLKKIYISSHVSIINEHVFMHCSALKLMKIPKNVNEISSKAFAGCDNLTTIIVWKIEKIKINPCAFNGCQKLTINSGINAKVNKEIMYVIYKYLTNNSTNQQDIDLSIQEIVNSINTTMIFSTKETDLKYPKVKEISYNPQDVSNLLNEFELENLNVYEQFEFNKKETFVNSDTIDETGITKEVYNTLVQKLFKEPNSPLKTQTYAVDSNTFSTRLDINKPYNPREYLSLGYIVGQMLSNAFDVTLEIPLSYVDIGILVVIYILKYYKDNIKTDQLEKFKQFLHKIIKACACHDTNSTLLDGSCKGDKPVEHNYDTYYDQFHKELINELIFNTDNDMMNKCLHQFYTGIVDKFMYNSKYTSDISMNNFGNMLKFVSKSSKYVESLKGFLNEPSNATLFLTGLKEELDKKSTNISAEKKTILEKKIKRCYEAITGSSGIPYKINFKKCESKNPCPYIFTCFTTIGLPEILDSSYEYGHFDYMYNACNNILINEKFDINSDKNICILKLCEKGDEKHALGWFSNIKEAIYRKCERKYKIYEKTFCCKEELEFNLDDYQVNSLYHLIIITHGDKNAITVGENETLMDKDKSFYKLANKLQDKLADNASILFASCNVGQIDQNISNIDKCERKLSELTNTDHDNFANNLSKQLKGIHIYATPGSQEQDELEICHLNCENFDITYKSSKQVMYKYLTKKKLSHGCY